MCMGLSMCLKVRRPVIRWKLKVRLTSLRVILRASTRHTSLEVLVHYGKSYCPTSVDEQSRDNLLTTISKFHSQTTHRAPKPSQRRTILHRRPRAHAPQYSRKHKREGQVVEHIPAGSTDRGGHISSMVVEEVL